MRLWLRRFALMLALIVAPLVTGPARASLTGEQLAQVGVNPRPDAALPLDVTLTDLDGRPTTLRDALSRLPAVVVFVDFRCTQLCSPILAVTGAALEASGLTPGRDYRLIAIGFNPRATAADARAMIGGQIGSGSGVGRATIALIAGGAAFERLADAVGYRIAYDPQETRYAHPAALFVVTPNGRVKAVLAGLSITGEDAKQALLAARGEGGAAAIVNQIRLLCYGLGASVGRYTGAVRTLLMATGVATLLAVGATLTLFWRASAGGRN